jgi:hypothetical protein
MKTCKATGLEKHGTLEAANAAKVLAGAKHTHEVERCQHCRCLHVVPAKANKLPGKQKRLEPTRGVSGWVHLDVEEIKHETEKAFLFVIDGEEKWFPKGVVADYEEYAKGDKNCTVSIQEWFLAKVET